MIRTTESNGGVIVFTGWILVDCVKLFGCPKCGSGPDQECTEWDGKERIRPHTQRVIAFIRDYEGAKEAALRIAALPLELQMMGMPVAAHYVEDA